MTALPLSYRIFFGVALISQLMLVAFVAGCIAVSRSVDDILWPTAYAAIAVGAFLAALGFAAPCIAAYREKRHGRYILVPIDSFCPDCGSPRYPLVDPNRIEEWKSCPRGCGDVTRYRKARVLP